MLFAENLTVAAVLDWELVTLANPEIDVAWWLFIMRHHTEGIGVPVPQGMPDPAATIARYQELTGHTLEHLDYYEVYAAWRLSIAMVRAAHMMIAAGLLPPYAPMAQHNPASKLLATTIGAQISTSEVQSFIGNR